MNRARLVLLVLLLAPPLAAAAAPPATLRLDAPSAAPVGVPFLVEVCVADAPPGPLQAKVAMRGEEGGAARVRQAGAVVASGRYGPPFHADEDGRACVDAELEDRGPPGARTLEAKVRTAEGRAMARAAATLQAVAARVSTLAADGDAALLDADGGVRLRVRALEGVLVVPHLPDVRAARAADGATHPLAAPSGARLAEARADGTVLVENAGEETLLLGGHRLAARGREVALPPVVLAPGERVEARVPGLRAGPLALRVASVEVDVLDVPRLPPGRAVDREGRVFVPGRTSIPALPMPVEGTLLAYATPDAGASPVLDLVASAREEILVEGYTLTSPDVAAALLDARARGVRVRVLLEGAPVGGVSPAQRDAVGALVAAGAEASYLRSADEVPARYASVHAKTLVVDRRAVLVATENLHESSYPAVAGAPGTRGFGLVVANATLADLFARVFEADAGAWPDVAPAPPALPGAPRPLPRAGAQAGPVLALQGRWNVTPVVAPDAGTAWVPALVGSAEASVDVAMLFAEPAFDAGPSPFLEALVEAARRGVRVRLLLDGHLDAEGNGAVVRALAERAARERLPLEARLFAPGRTLHAKLVVVDGARSYVGSMNWGEASATRNREAGLVVESREAAAWYGRAFGEAWEGPPSREAREAPGPGTAAGMAAVAVATLIPRGPRARRPPGPRRG